MPRMELLQCLVVGLGFSRMLKLFHVSGILRMSSVMIFQTRSIRFFRTIYFFKFNISLPLVTGELLQKTVDVTYKLYNIKIYKDNLYYQTLKNYLPTGAGNHVITKKHCLHHRYRSGQVKSVVRYIRHHLLETNTL